MKYPRLAFIACIVCRSSLSTAFTTERGRYSARAQLVGATTRIHNYGVANRNVMLGANDLIAWETSSSFGSRDSDESGAITKGTSLKQGGITKASTLESLERYRDFDHRYHDHDCDDRPRPKKCKHPKSDKD